MASMIRRLDVFHSGAAAGLFVLAMMWIGFGDGWCRLFAGAPVTHEVLRGTVLVDVVWDNEVEEYLVVVLIDDSTTSERDGVADRMYFLQTREPVDGLHFVGDAEVRYARRTLEVTRLGSLNPEVVLALDATAEATVGQMFVDGYGLSRQVLRDDRWKLLRSGLSFEQRQILLTSCTVPSDPESGCLVYGGSGPCSYECNGSGGSIECEEGTTCCGWCQDHIVPPDHGCVRCLDQV